eukprot:jgi/Botrbrau1/16769/Bobra.150_2s0004.1
MGNGLARGYMTQVLEPSGLASKACVSLLELADIFQFNLQTCLCNLMISLMISWSSRNLPKGVPVLFQVCRWCGVYQMRGEG